MRAVFVVVRHVLREDLLEMTATEDEESGSGLGVLEPVALALGLDDAAAVGEPVESREPPGSGACLRSLWRVVLQKPPDEIDSPRMRLTW